MTTLTLHAMRAELRKAIGRRGIQTVADATGYKAYELRLMVLARGTHTPVAPAVAQYLGYERRIEVTYVRQDEDA